VGVAVLVGVGAKGANLASFVEIFFVAIGYAVGPLVVVRFLYDAPSLGVVTAHPRSLAIKLVGRQVQCRHPANLATTWC